MNAYAPPFRHPGHEDGPVEQHMSETFEPKPEFLAEVMAILDAHGRGGPGDDPGEVDTGEGPGAGVLSLASGQR